MYICSQSGELVHPIHLQHMIEEQESSVTATTEVKEGDTDEDDVEGTSPPLERGTPVHAAL